MEEPSSESLDSASPSLIFVNNNNNNGHFMSEIIGNNIKNYTTTSSSSSDGSSLLLLNDNDIDDDNKIKSDISSYYNQLEQLIQMNLVRRTVSQYWPELIFIIVIIIYLIYYFGHLSKKPKLIGNDTSDFVAFIKLHLKETLENPFRPLSYWWGTNTQTALFGHLQGRTSLTKEMSDLMVKRQYLYVSDLQYLTSNVDLSKYYRDPNKRDLKIRLKSLVDDSTLLDFNHYRSEEMSKCQNIQEQEQEQQQHVLSQVDLESRAPETQLNKNIRLALEGMIMSKEEKRRVNGERDDMKKNRVNKYTKKGLLNVGSSTSTSSSSSSTSDRHHSTNSSAASTASDSGHSSTISGLAPSGSTSSSSSTTSSSSTSSLHDESSQQERHSLCDECPDNSLDSAISDSSSKLSQNFFPINNHPSSFDENAQNRSRNNRYLSEQIDFGQCALDWFLKGHENYHQNKLVALISPGMTTGSDKKYVTDTVETLESLGYECCVFIRRGVGGLKLNSAKFFSCSKWRDFEAAVQSVRQQRPGARLVAIGFSFGSVELCRYLAMRGKQSQVDAALLVSCPFDPVCGTLNMHQGSYLNKRIDAYLAKHLGKQLYSATLLGERTSMSPSLSSSPSSIPNTPTTPTPTAGASASAITTTTAAAAAAAAAATTTTTTPTTSSISSSLSLSASSSSSPSASSSASASSMAIQTSEDIESKGSDNKLALSLIKKNRLNIKMKIKNNKIIIKKSKSKKNKKMNKSGRRESYIWTNENGISVDLAHLPKLKSIYDFEYKFNRVLQHYPTPGAYANDCKIDISSIETPTLCLSSEDDFMAPLRLLPLAKIKLNKNLCMILTKRGGHMAFIDGILWPKKPYFAQRVISHYMGALKKPLSEISKDGSYANIIK